MFSFPYQTKTIKEGEIFIPVVKVELKTIKGFWPFEMLLDSGADVTTLPLKPLASYFPNFRKDPATRTVIGGIEGKGVAAFPYTLLAKIGNINFNMRCYFIESNVDSLLGRLDFWNLFSVSFDNQKGQTTIFPNHSPPPNPNNPNPAASFRSPPPKAPTNATI